ncbi:uncharacterized protein LOC129737574 [Uranotaenia lowii]|uniref:uncharacterized protein LOC129737574 n=1 Tax=Uranotaenia lowii TaxID=190385 RepID=UPI002478ACAE|nr:uncharacterized protein LOC129737574 [Uranotaenia lowii]
MCFDNLKSNIRIRECCILARVLRYEPQQQIAVSESGGSMEYAFFVLSGQCLILQCLKTMKKMRGKRECYRLLSPESGSKQVAIAERLSKRKDSDVLESVLPANIRATLLSIRSRGNSYEDAANRSDLFEDNPERLAVLKTSLPEETLEHHFIDVGSYSCGSVFGLGERMEDRSIVARNHVQCMLIPRYWLFMKHQNTGNVWQRIKMYLDLAIPSRESLFQQFLDDRNWMAYRRKVIKDIIDQRGRQNKTRLIDVPIMCRVEQNGSH